MEDPIFQISSILYLKLINFCCAFCSGFVFAPLQPQNSATLPACFVLRLKEPLPICVSLVKKIQQVTEMECGDLSCPRPLLGLITEHASKGQLDCSNNRGLYVVSYRRRFAECLERGVDYCIGFVEVRDI